MSHYADSLEIEAELNSVSSAVTRIERSLHTRKKGQYLRKEEMSSLLSSLEYLATKEDWERVVDLSSRAIVAGCGVHANLAFYRTWIEGLKHECDVGNLQALARHLLTRRHEHNDFLSLALFALTYAGRRTYANAVANTLKNRTQTSVLAAEAIGTFLCESYLSEDRKKGLKILNRVWNKSRFRYLSLLNFFSYCTQHEADFATTKLLNTLSSEFPLCAEPHWVAARLAMTQGCWNEALQSLSNILKLNPRNEMACLAYAECLERAGDFLAAHAHLNQNRNLFPDNDFDFNYCYGEINARLYERYGHEKYRSAAINHLVKADTACQKLRTTLAPIHVTLHDLKAGVGEQQTAQRRENQAYWLFKTDNSEAKALLSEKGFLLKCPAELKEHDVIFFGRNAESDAKVTVDGFYKVTSPSVPDSTYGHLARIEIRMFERSVGFEINSAMELMVDQKGCVNFSSQHFAEFYTLRAQDAAWLVDQTEAPQTFGPARGRHAS